MWDCLKERENRMDAIENQEKLTASQVIRQELEKLCDPDQGMTEEEHAQYKNKILAKIERGKKLTAKEMSYLRVHDPVAYQRARRMEQKRMQMEARLKKCKSKQEVEEVVNEAVSNISEKDPDKQAIIATYQEVKKEFKKTPKYRSLPDTKKEAEAKTLHGKRKRKLLGKTDSGEEMLWLLQEEAYGADGLRRVNDEATPLDELYDAMPDLDVTG